MWWVKGPTPSRFFDPKLREIQDEGQLQTGHEKSACLLFCELPASERISLCVCPRRHVHIATANHQYLQPVRL